MTALALQHVVVLDDNQISALVAAGNRYVASNDGNIEIGATLEPLIDQLQFGENFTNALDERVRLDERKKILKAATDAVTKRIAELNEQLDEEWAERGITQERHAASGKLVHRNRGRCFAKVVRAGDDVQPEERQAACDALKTDPATADFVREDFHSGALGAHFKELAEHYDATQRELAPSLRQPRHINDFLPPACVGYVELSDNPTISVRS